MATYYPPLAWGADDRHLGPPDDRRGIPTASRELYRTRGVISADNRVIDTTPRKRRKK